MVKLFCSNLLVARKKLFLNFFLDFFGSLQNWKNRMFRVRKWFYIGTLMDLYGNINRFIQERKWIFTRA